MKLAIGVLTALAGFLGIIGSAIAMRYWLVTLVIISILKITNLVAVPWFAGITTVGAISTGLWMLFGGLIMLFVSAIITAIGTTLIE
jgi:hypothetical protein